MTADATEKQRATAATAIALGMEAAAERGVPDAVVVHEMTRITLALLAAANGGEPGLATWLEAQAAAIRARGDQAPRPVTIN